MSRLPLYRRIAEDLRRAIAGGRLPPGARLPSSRALARQLGISRNTVLTAYDSLAADGLLAGRTGSGTVVKNAPAPRLDPRRLLRDAHYPARSVSFRDADGNSLHLQL